MSEGAVLFLVARYPHPTALARHTHDQALFVALRRLERRGLVRLYHLTGRGRDELVQSRRLASLVARASYA